MTDNAAPYFSLAVGAMGKALYVLLALALTLVLFAFLPVLDSIGQGSRTDIRLVARTVVVRPRPNLVNPAVATQQRHASHKTEKARLRNRPSRRQESRASALVRPIAYLAPSLALPMTTLQPGLGDMSADFRIVAPRVSAATLVPSHPSAPRVVRLPPAYKTTLGVRDLDAPPLLLAAVRPIYPLQAKQCGIEGYVDIEFVIEANGVVSTVRVLEAKPPGVCDESAGGAARRWRFSVPLKDGKAVTVLARQRIQFRWEK